MNVNSRTLFRTLAIAILAAIGFTTAVSSCGGSSSGSTTPPPSNLLAIDANNAFDVSSALITAASNSFDIGEITGGAIMGQPAVASSRLQKTLWDFSAQATIGAAEAGIAEVCPDGGSANITTTLANPNTLTVGDQITADFDSCDQGNGYVLDGLMALTIAAIDGDIITDVFLVGLDMTMTAMTITEGTDTVTIDANMTLTVDALGFPVIVQTLEGAELRLATESEESSFTNFVHVFEVDTGLTPEAVRVTIDGTLESAQLGGAIDYTTPLVIQASGDYYPHAGRVLITGIDSTVTIVIKDSRRVTLEVDTNNDGVIDEYIDTTFAELIGDASIVNSSTALAVAQEVTHAGTGFGLMASVPGSVFAVTGPFDQVRQLALSGDFGPLEITCGDAGTAVVSGFVANAGTFTADDSLSAIVSDCVDLSAGQLDFVVSSFSQKSPYDPEFTAPFQVVGTMTLAGLEHAASTVSYVGSGTLEVDYDYQQYFGPMFVNGSSSSFSITHADVVNTLSDVSVNLSASIDFGRHSSYAGQLVSDRFNGAYSFESVLPYAWYSAESPVGGELLIIAEDGSSVRIVVVDARSIRLDIDYDGDSKADAAIPTTWAELLQ